MKSILKAVASEYTQRYKYLKEICFLFPNKRSGVFLRKYFQESDVFTEDLPHITTISELLAQVARKTEARKVELLFLLYNCYLEILNKKDSGEGEEFDSFRNWGEIVLSDFNTIDMALVDPEVIFKNLRDYRTLSTNFFTEDQKEVLEKYFGVTEFGDPSEFWKHFEDPEKLSELKKGFLNLWQVLGPLHTKFIEKLEERGLGSPGSIYRAAAEKVKERGRNAFPYKKIVVVGFNALTEAERVIFKELQKEEGYPGYDDFIDFIWDATGPVLKNPEFSASRFIDYNKEHFPSPEWLKDSLAQNDVDDFPQIQIIGAPSNTSQVKVAYEILKQYDGEEARSLIENSEVALVLPDESLLSPMLYSIPEQLTNINLTMSFTLRNTAVNSFMALLRRLYAGMHDGKEDQIFYVKDLNILFTHPYSYILFGEEGIGEVKEYTGRFHKVSISLKEISDFIPQANDLLCLPSKKNKEGSIFVVVKRILEALMAKIGEGLDNPEEDQEYQQVKTYGEYVDSLEETLKHYKINPSALSSLSMLEKLIGGEKIGFEGEPITGLQIMGTLETRSLDFKHVIVMSMNEGIMPRRAYTSTFIPETLRKDYGLPPARYAEEIFGYYFYRLISRAEKVTLIYDGRTISGLRGGESRYLLQLREYVPSDKITEESWRYHMANREVNFNKILKTPEIHGMLEAFLPDNTVRKNFSASSLNTYRECGIKFFLQSVLNVSGDEERSEYMDAITIGNVLHEVMMDIYLPEKLHNKLLKQPVIIDRDMLENILSRPEIIKKSIQKKIGSLYYGNSLEEEVTVKSGVTEIIAGQIEELVKSIVRYDLKLTPFKLYGCEVTKKIEVKLSNGRMVNFRFAIDRLDEIEIEGEKHLRIVDYKTGAQKRKAEDLNEVFLGGYKSEQIFQLFTYAWLLGKIGYDGWEDVMTEIYYVPDLISGKGGLPEIGGEKVTSFREYYQEFNTLLENMINDIFDGEAFMESLGNSGCSFCNFKSFCGKA